MNKSEIRAQLANDLVAFSQLGGEITTLRSQQVRTKNTAACRYRRGQSYKGEGLAKSEPKSLRSWCYWGGDRLLNIPYKTGMALSAPKPIIISDK